MYETQPWLRHYGDAPRSLACPRPTVTEAFADSVRRFPDAPAFDFLGQRATYRELGEAVDRCASGLGALGLEAGDRIAVALPTAPQGVIAFHAALRLGAVPVMLPPTAAPADIAHYLDAARCRFAVTIDAFYEHFATARSGTPLERLVLACMPESLGSLQRLGYGGKHGRGGPVIPDDPAVSWWKDVVGGDVRPARAARPEPDDVAAILFTAGGTGRPKGVLLSHRNLVAEGVQIGEWLGLRPGDAMLAATPLHGGFGLGAFIGATLLHGGCCVLVPLGTAADVARQIRRTRPQLIAGSPAEFEALVREPALRTADLSRLRVALCSTGTLPRATKESFEALVAAGGGAVRVVEGYRLTETVSTAIATPDEYREGSIGVPLPGNLAKVVRMGTHEEIDPGSEGEICISGPSVMQGYLDDPDATAAALQMHGDGRKWLHTGDVGRMDYDGYFYFTCRSNRVIRSGGFNVYPPQVEAVLAEHPAVAEVCVVGVPDESQAAQRVKAYVVLKPGIAPSPAVSAELIAHCRTQLILGSCPREIEFRSALPRTSSGEVNHRALVEPRTIPVPSVH